MQNALLNIDGMEGQACADKINELLAGIDGVADVRVSLRDGQASVRLDETLISPYTLVRGLALAGYPSYPAFASPALVREKPPCAGDCRLR